MLVADGGESKETAAEVGRRLAKDGVTVRRAADLPALETGDLLAPAAEPG